MLPTSPPPSQRLLVFARLPEEGKVKTRLAAAIGQSNALRVYRMMLADLLRSIGSAEPDFEIEILWAPTELATGERLRSAFGSRPLAVQTGETLGDRLAMAFSERFFFHRTHKIAAIGADDPLLPRALIDEAFFLLDSCEWVIGPAADGGYYLIACRGGAFRSEIFRDIPWGTAEVLELTLKKIEEWGSTVALLPERFDIDELADLRTFAKLNVDGQLADLLRAEPELVG